MKKLRRCIWNIRCFIQPFYGLDEMICVSRNIGLFWLIEHLIKQKKLLNDDELMAKLCDTIQKTDINWCDLITHQDHIKEVLV